MLATLAVAVVVVRALLVRLVQVQHLALVVTV
jgi:hypothetical protein